MYPFARRGSRHRAKPRVGRLTSAVDGRPAVPAGRIQFRVRPDTDIGVIPIRTSSAREPGKCRGAREAQKLSAASMTAALINDWLFRSEKTQQFLFAIDDGIGFEQLSHFSRRNPTHRRDGSRGGNRPVNGVRVPLA
jgi:hypothetical protein